MAGTRELVLRAAIRILGTEGVRALTHARIDTVAGVPPGSCSNYFRTRRALLTGIAEQMASDELSAFERFADAPPSRDELVDQLTRVVELQTGPGRIATLARHRLFLEVAEGDAADVFGPGRARFTAWTARALGTLGTHDDDAVRAFMAGLDGLILHRLTVDDSGEVSSIIRYLLDGVAPAH
jgi:DNA-binding transcriptional regulator YbjK